MATSATIFYFLQNSSQLSGGNIALAKTFWLTYTILLWFVLPAILISDPRTPNTWKTIYRIFLTNMIVRAIVELLMIYAWFNWRIAYGLTHDILSIALLLILALKNKQSLHNTFYRSTLIVFLLMFIIEIIFVSYMSSNIPDAGSQIYFVPEGKEHSLIISITWVVNFLLTIYLYYFSRTWLNEK